ISWPTGISEMTINDQTYRLVRSSANPTNRLTLRARNPITSSVPINWKINRLVTSRPATSRSSTTMALAFSQRRRIVPKNSSKSDNGLPRTWLEATANNPAVAAGRVMIGMAQRLHSRFASTKFAHFSACSRITRWSALEAGGGDPFHNVALEEDENHKNRNQR